MTGYKSVEFKIQGVAPLLMHDGKLTDPLNRVSIAMSEITSKSKKTHDDLRLLAQLEFLGSIYTVDDLEFSINGYDIQLQNDPKLCIPSDNIEAVLIKGAEKARKGKQAKAGILVESNPLLMGAPSAKKLFADPYNYFFRKRVVVKRNAIMRTRAIFRDWSLQFAVHYLPGLMNEADVVKSLTIAGATIGIGDYRPKYGRFSLTS
jgi:hypothetical protein